MAGFTAAAEVADSQLHHAADLVNGDISATSMQFKPATLAAIRALDNAPVARAIPAGLPAELLRDVLVVYADLSSRTAGFGGVLENSYSGALPIGSQQAREVLRGLRNGALAAARFNADLVAVRGLAQQTPPLLIATRDSRAAADLALRLDSIDSHNFCSAEFGGWVPTTLAAVSWQPSTDQQARHYDGTIDGIRFEADYVTEQGWKISIYAC